MTQAMIRLLDEQRLELDGQGFDLVREIGVGKAARSYLYQRGERLITLKRYRSTEQMQVPFDELLDFEMLGYRRLCEADIPTPRLLGYCRQHYCLVKEYIQGPVMIDWVAEGRISDELFAQMFAINNRLKNKGYHVDYYPANFVLHQGRLYCVDYEAHHYLEEWDFPHWGIYYWLNQAGMQQFLVNPDPLLINKANSYKPHDEPFRAQRDALLARFGHWQ